MKIEGIHHVTCITGDAPGNVDFYVRVLGLRMVKKTVNQDDPTVYHLFYADEAGSAGADITFFEYPGSPRGRAGDGMVHTTVFRVGSDASLDYWAERLGSDEVATHRDGKSLRFEDPEGLGLELMVTDAPDAPLVAEHPDIPAEHRLQGFEGVRAYSSAPGNSQRLLEEGLGFESGRDDTWTVIGDERRGWITYDEPPQQRGLSGAGTVHHVAWASTMDDHEAWRERVRAVGMHPTPVIDRFWFLSVYFREPSGVLFEIATLGPGFTADEPLETLGEKLTLPPKFEGFRDQLEQALTPLPDTTALRS
ncbi:MAG: glyoxalase family protein [Thermoleophilaceae bacterium]|jgi:glyoxalase family protein|nr:glyoxalase family protein [Thermoleophilaceae bacterium]